MKPMNEGIFEQIEQQLGSVQHVQLLDEQGCTSEVHQIITHNGRYILKSAVDSIYREWLEEEASVLEKLQHQSTIPVPTFHGFIKQENQSHLIMSYEEGITLTVALAQANEEEKRALLKSFGQFLHQLHQSRTIAALDHREDWLERMLQKAEENLRRGQADGDQQLLERLKDNRPGPVPQTMIHGDCTTDNVLVIDGEVRIFIDLAFMTVGDPRYDVALAIRKFIDNGTYLHAFYEGYQANRITMEEFRYFDEGVYEFF